MLAAVLGWASADAVDWTRLFHAYGVATDTPGHLRALTGDDPELQDAGADHLDSAVLHQGSVSSSPGGHRPHPRTHRRTSG
jgi:hypothetical protein